ncbi:ABC transporter ATP-binding protein [Glycomyces buryatensis]|uniref:ABC transporter ATP-binding protein n=1 Tax=Glycomyces buryatensis TaxID=2570927 RepID=A0A4S8Q5W1_9ACTN|nr:ABC transporter ATP-binding protein [Glycomyces buryatensis]THV39697.1 ABC transporter ATP-binding protein [Glycomyces buryatensis]
MTTLTKPRPGLHEDPTRPLALLLRDVTKTYDGAHKTLDHVSLQVPRGSFLAIMGPSGSGKSTLLHCAAGLDSPDSGEIRIGGTDIAHLSETQRTRSRRSRIGFVFQAYNLLPSLTVEENITLPLRLAGTDADKQWLRSLVDRIGLGDLLHRRPGGLSGGQQQRAAIARSLAARPEVVFADEPTGALDSGTAAEVLDLLRDLVDELGQTVVMVTHDPNAAARAHATAVVADGRIDQYFDRPTADELARRLTHLRGARA